MTNKCTLRLLTDVQATHEDLGVIRYGNRVVGYVDRFYLPDGKIIHTCVDVKLGFAATDRMAEVQRILKLHGYDLIKIGTLEIGTTHDPL